MQLKMVDLLFKSYFEERGDPGSHDLLSKFAVEAGVFPSTEKVRNFLDAATDADLMLAHLRWISQAITFLQGDELKKEVKQGIAKAQMRGISGVPFTILNGQSALARRVVRDRL